MKKNENALRNNFIWNSVGNFVYLACQWLVTVVVVRITNYKEAGVLSLAMSITNTFYSIAVWGIRTYQVSDVDNKYKDNTYIYSRYVTCTIAIVFCVIFTMLNRYDIRQAAVIIVYMFFRSIEAYLDVIHGVDQKADRMDFIGKSFLMRGIVLLVGFIITLLFTGSVLWGVVCIALSSMLICVAYDIPRSMKLRSDCSCTSFKTIIQLLGECFPLVIYTFLMTAVSLVPRYFLEKMSGSELLGIYASIATPAVIVQAAASYIMAPFITPIAELVEKKEYQQYINLNKKILKLMFISFAVVMIGAYLLKDIGLRILFGEDILQYADLFMPVIFCTTATALSWYINMLLTIYRDFKGLLISNFIGLICSAALSVPLINIMGLNGTSFSLLISTMVIIALSLYFLARDHRRGFEEL